MSRQQFTFTFRFSRMVVDLTQQSGYRAESFPVVVQAVAENRTAGIRIDLTAVWNGINNLLPFLNFQNATSDIEAAAQSHAENQLTWEKEAAHV